MSTDLAVLEDLHEGQVVHGLALTVAEAAALNSGGLATAAPGPGGWTVTAEYAAGVMRRGALTVRVRPKIGTARVLTLLARALSTSGLKVDAETADVAPDADLSAVLATLFVHEAERAMAGGPSRGYRTEDQSLPVLRGRLRLRDQHLRRFGMLSPVEVTVDEWTVDTDDNRRLRTAVRLLLLQPGIAQGALTSLRWLDRMLVDVTQLPPGASLPPWTPSRLNSRLHDLLHLADLVLMHRSVEHQRGDTSVHGFSVSMWWLFEKLVHRLLYELEPGWDAQARFRLDNDDVLTIKPDLVLRGTDGPLAVADCKYKLLGVDGYPTNGDVYQMVTYCQRFGLARGHLLHAGAQRERGALTIRGAGTVVEVHSVDITASVEDIERQVQALASRLGGAAILAQPIGA